MNDYLEYVLEQLAGLGPVRPRKMFGGIGLYAEDLFFALIARDVLYLKVDDTNRADYEARESQPFRPNGEEGGAMSYWELPVDVLEKPAEALAWARRSLEIARRKQASRAAKKAPRRAVKKSAQGHASSSGTSDPRLAQLRNLGPKSASWLREVGLETRADLERTGSLGAYRLVREARGKASLNLLYALEGALLDVSWTELPAALKQQLRDSRGT